MSRHFVKISLKYNHTKYSICTEDTNALHARWTSLNYCWFISCRCDKCDIKIIMSIQCSICSYSSYVPSEVNRHHANVHNLGQTQRKLYKCDMCPYTTYDVFLRNQHKIDAHHREKLTQPNLNLYYVNNKPDYWKVDRKLSQNVDCKLWHTMAFSS